MTIGEVRFLDLGSRGLDIGGAMPKGTPPPRVKPKDDSGYFEEMTKAVFRSGFSWQVIENKWPNFKQAFDGFSVEKVAAYDTRDVDRLLSDEGIVRNGRKIESTIHNARTIKQLAAEHGSFDGYLRSIESWEYAARSKDLQKRFKHLGRTGTYTFLWSVAEEVPDWEDR
jgi:3-methyladenine DNA glycosylase Tag